MEILDHLSHVFNQPAWETVSLDAFAESRAKAETLTRPRPMDVGQLLYISEITCANTSSLSHLFLRIRVVLLGLLRGLLLQFAHVLLVVADVFPIGGDVRL